MGKVLKSLQLQFFFILCIVYVKAAPYSKYGRKCTDIGCLPREVCIIAYDTCSFNQQEGTNCGKYPTCIKADRNQQQQPPAQNTGPILSPSPENTRSSNTEYSPPRDNVNPNNIFGFPSNSNYPNMNPPNQMPLDNPRLPDNRQPFPSMPKETSSFGFNHPELTPPPNVFGPFIPRTTTSNPNFLDQFFTGKQQRNNSSINNANLISTFMSSAFLLLFYRFANIFM